MEAAPDDTRAVLEVLDLLTSLPALSAVTLYHQRADGTTIYITVRRSVQPPGQGTRHHYWWGTRLTTGGQVWDDAGAHAYPTAATTYQAAVQAVPAVPAASGHRPGEATADAS